MQYIYGILVIGVMTWAVISFATNDEPLEKFNNNQSEYHFAKTVARDNISAVHLKLNIPASVFNMTSNSNSLLDADIHYSHRDFEPEFTDRNRSDRTLDITISQDSKREYSRRNNVDNTWHLNTSPNIPYNYEINLGAGKVDVDLSGSQVNRFELKTGAASADINLRNSLVSDIELNAGVGSVSLDVSGDRHSNLKANINGGIGALTIYVPKGTAVRFRASGLGSVNADGFTRNGSYHQNSKWNQTDYSIDVVVSAGIGVVTVIEQ